ncbi:hypothetical protein LPJ53_001070 [Coemansia erecta]|uniref:Non-structural maintenance of chromosomes element 1 homolog n=1 Tax=Coemansia erecta TaxID=147472 RepID=A0A9W7Y0S4_9FUNG|nr:hypothetical protein LPJ53_001070 [Coemansia erecta]
MSAQLFTDAQFRKTLERICNSSSDDQSNGNNDDDEVQEVTLDVHQHVESINSSLSNYSLELRSAPDQNSGVRMWAIANTNADATVLGATPYSQPELAILKALVEGIFTESTGNYALSLHSALRIAVNNSTPAIQRSHAEKLIEMFCKDGWLMRDEAEGFVVIGTRAIIELASFFTDGFGDYRRHCALCSELATQGLVCTECDAVVHPCCAKSISSSLAERGELSCPKCRRQIASPMRFGPGQPGVPHETEPTQQADPAEDIATAAVEELSLNSPRGKKRAMDDDEDEISD